VAKCDWIYLNRKPCEIFNVLLAMLIPSVLAGNPFVALETQLGEPVFLLE
jgi:hypothetical protein